MQERRREAVGEEQLGNAEHDVVRTELVHGVSDGIEVGQRIGVPMHRALGPSGRPRRVLHVGRFIGAQWRRARRRQIGDGLADVLGDEDARRGSEPGGDGLIRNDQRGTGVGEQRGVIRRREPGVHGDGHGAHPQRSEKGRGEADGVGGHHQDAIAGPHATLAQQRGDASRAVEHLAERVLALAAAQQGSLEPAAVMRQHLQRRRQVAADERGCAHVSRSNGE